MTHSSKKAARQKPSKPRPDFPLFPHAAGVWAKTIAGKTRYFGSWSDPEAALQRYLDERDDLYAGRTPSKRKGTVTIRDLANAFWRHGKSKVEAGEMSPRTWHDYQRVMDRIVRVLGKNASLEGLTPDDFARLREDICRNNSPVSVAGLITRCKVVFNFAHKSDLIQQPVRYGLSFQRPPKKVIRAAKQRNGNKLYTAEECRQLIEKAPNPELRCMILLGLNCGFGNADCANLPIQAVDFENAVIDWPRPKTAVERRCPLWAETVESLRVVLSRRKEGRVNVFVTKRGNSYADHATSITHEFRKLTDELGIHRKGVGFYSLRHTFRTVADATRDFPAIRCVMGHTDDSMDSVYTEEIGDDRLRAVVDHVRAWLHGSL